MKIILRFCFFFSFWPLSHICTCMEAKLLVRDVHHAFLSYWYIYLTENNLLVPFHGTDCLNFAIWLIAYKGFGNNNISQNRCTILPVHCIYLHSVLQHLNNLHYLFPIVYRCIYNMSFLSLVHLVHLVLLLTINNVYLYIYMSW